MRGNLSNADVSNCGHRRSGLLLPKYPSSTSPQLAAELTKLLHRQWRKDSPLKNTDSQSMFLHTIRIRNSWQNHRSRFLERPDLLVTGINIWTALMYQLSALILQGLQRL